MVAMFDVLEHLRNPLADIRYASNLLQSNGLLIISTGLLDTWIWAWLKGEHWYFQSSKHICVATRHFFENSAQNCNLKVIGIHRISHQIGTIQEQQRDLISVAYYGMRSRGGFFRLPQIFIHSLPGYRGLRHQRSVP